MNQKLISILIVAVVFIGIIYVSIPKGDADVVTVPDSIMKDDNGVSSGMPIQGSDSEDVIVDDTKTDDTIMEKDAESTTVMNESRYLSYTPELFESRTTSKRVYFFYASWCPTCRPADGEFTLQQENIPGDVTLFRTDYDYETKLKTMYGVTYQHTFVYVDVQGKEIAIWNGGGLDELIEHTQTP